MGWETIITQVGRGDSVTVSWRVPGGRSTPAMAVSLSKGVATTFGLVKGSRQAVVVQRDRMAGKLRLCIATGEPRHERRSMAWKDGGCAVVVPLDDVRLTEKKPAQDVPWCFTDGGRHLEIKLPPWACPPVKVGAAGAA